MVAEIRYIKNTLKNSAYHNVYNMKILCEMYIIICKQGSKYQKHIENKLQKYLLEYVHHKNILS